MESAGHAGGVARHEVDAELRALALSPEELQAERDSAGARQRPEVELPHAAILESSFQPDDARVVRPQGEAAATPKVFDEIRNGGSVRPIAAQPVREFTQLGPIIVVEQR